MKTPFHLREGYEKLKQELNYLWREERPEVTKKVTWAAEWATAAKMLTIKYNKKRLVKIDRRVRYLTKCLENLKIVDYSPQQEGKVFFGAWVEIENDDGVTHRFRIVSSDEIFGRKDYISIEPDDLAFC
ncbi:transcription elongation factor GreB [Escherichia coli]